MFKAMGSYARHLLACSRHISCSLYYGPIPAACVSQVPLLIGFHIGLVNGKRMMGSRKGEARISVFLSSRLQDECLGLLPGSGSGIHPIDPSLLAPVYSGSLVPKSW